jgi:hypothetical protein
MRRNLLLLIAISAVLLLAACNGSSITPEPIPDDTQKAPSVVLDWNEASLAAVRNGQPRPTVVARSLYIASAAMYDAWAAYDDAATPVALDPSLRRPANERTAANQEKAVAYAAHAVLGALFAPYELNTGAFSTLLNQEGYGVNDTEDPTLPAGIGNLAAEAVLAARATDGSNAANNFADVDNDLYGALYAYTNSADPTMDNSFMGVNFDVNHWCPLRVPTGKLLNPDGSPLVDPTNPNSFSDQKFLTPHWGSVTPFALTNGNQLRPEPPPFFGDSNSYTDALGNVSTGDEAFKSQFDEILDISAHLTDEQKVIAEYWADGPRSETPPGHWNALAQGIAMRDNHGVSEDVKMFLALNGALLDASIACWDAKRAYDSCRPVAGIRFLHNGEQVQAWGGPGKGTLSISGETWKPFQAGTFVTPGFPEYTSGHSTFSAAAAEVLTKFTGSSTFYDGHTRTRRDYNGDGVLDLLGQYTATALSLKIEPTTPESPVTLQWPTFKDAADQAGLSRRYGGIHIQDADLRGRAMGKEIGGLAYDKAKSLWGAE